MDDEENNLTNNEDSGIISGNRKVSMLVTINEKRILTNLRRYGKMFPNSDLAVLHTFHKGEQKNALLCLGEGVDSNIKL